MHACMWYSFMYLFVCFRVFLLWVLESFSLSSDQLPPPEKYLLVVFICVFMYAHTPCSIGNDNIVERPTPLLSQVLESFTLSSDRLPPPGEWEPAGETRLQFTRIHGNKDTKP